jgi:hypothetical protein
MVVAWSSIKHDKPCILLHWLRSLDVFLVLYRDPALYDLNLLFTCCLGDHLSLINTYTSKSMSSSVHFVDLPGTVTFTLIRYVDHARMISRFGRSESDVLVSCEVDHTLYFSSVRDQQRDNNDRQRPLLFRLVCDYSAAYRTVVASCRL